MHRVRLRGSRSWVWSPGSRAVVSPRQGRPEGREGTALAGQQDLELTTVGARQRRGAPWSQRGCRGTGWGAVRWPPCLSCWDAGGHVLPSPAHLLALGSAGTGWSAVRWPPCLSCWDAGGHVLPSPAHLLALGSAGVGGPIAAAASTATPWKSQKLQVDAPQPGPGGASVPKGTLLKSPWLRTPSLPVWPGG